MRQVSRQEDAIRFQAMLCEAGAALHVNPRPAAVVANALVREAEAAGHLDCAAEAALLGAEAYRKLNATDTAQRLVGKALSFLERNGRTGRFGCAHKLQSMLLLSEDRIALALAAARRALLFPDLSDAERPYVYGTIAMCYGHLYHLELAYRVMVEQALPSADKSQNAEVICACNSRMAGLLHLYACMAMGIPQNSSFGIQPPSSLCDATTYLQQARKHLQVCASLVTNVSPVERCWYFAMNGIVTASTEGLSSAIPLFEAGLAIAGTAFPRARMQALAHYGMALRVAEKHQEALKQLQQAEALASVMNDESALRMINFELSIVYRALGQSQGAIDAMSAYARLHARKTLLATTWCNDPMTRHYYGEEPDLDSVRTAMLEPIEPPALKRADKYIECNVTRRVVIAELARNAGVSVRKLQQLYQQYRGVPASEVIRERRMQMARQLLNQQQLPVAIVADRIGYSSAANFSRDYRQRFGMTASSARRSVVRKIDVFATPN